jgi:protoporphyrinogen oxidase
MVEVTYREGDYTDSLSDEEIFARIKQGMVYLGFSDDEKDISLIDLYRHKYAYVIYDLNHKENMTAIREFFAGEGIYLNGRFGNFEYWNMDKVLREAKNMSELIGGKLG